MKTECLSIIYQRKKVLLGREETYRGKELTGIGGYVKRGERIEEAAIRQVEEQAGIVMLNPERVGRIRLSLSTESFHHLVHIFRAEDFVGKLDNLEARSFNWFDIAEIPYEQIRGHEQYWLPALLEGKYFTGNFFGKNSHSIHPRKIKLIDEGEWRKSAKDWK